MENRKRRSMTETEYRNEIKRIRKAQNLQAKLDNLAEEELKEKVVPRRNNPPPPRSAVRYVQPRPLPPIRGLLSTDPEPTTADFMSLLRTAPNGRKS